MELSVYDEIEARFQNQQQDIKSLQEAYFQSMLLIKKTMVSIQEQHRAEMRAMDEKIKELQQENKILNGKLLENVDSHLSIWSAVLACAAVLVL